VPLQTMSRMSVMAVALRMPVRPVRRVGESVSLRRQVPDRANGASSGVGYLRSARRCLTPAGVLARGVSTGTVAAH
jgi:hypothetical protein